MQIEKRIVGVSVARVCGRGGHGLQLEQQRAVGARRPRPAAAAAASGGTGSSSGSGSSGGSSGVEQRQQQRRCDGGSTLYQRLGGHAGIRGAINAIVAAELDGPRHQDVLLQPGHDARSRGPSDAPTRSRSA